MDKNKLNGIEGDGGKKLHWSKKKSRERNHICMMFIKSWINEMLQQPAGR